MSARSDLRHLTGAPMGRLIKRSSSACVNHGSTEAA